MLRLIKLEWQKHQMTRYLLHFLFCVAGVYGLTALLALGAKNDVDGAMQSFGEFMSLITILSNITFIVLGSVILSRLIIAEFRNKTIQVLFTYPIRRKTLMLAKLIITYVFVAGSVFVGIWIMQMMTYFIQPSLGLFKGTVTLTEIYATLPTTASNALMMGAIALIPLLFGMRKKSTATTITSGVIISFLINATFSNSGGAFSLANVVIIPLVLGLIGLSIAYLSIRNVDIKDVAS